MYLSKHVVNFQLEAELLPQVDHSKEMSDRKNATSSLYGTMVPLSESVSPAYSSVYKVGREVPYRTPSSGSSTLPSSLRRRYENRFSYPRFEAKTPDRAEPLFSDSQKFTSSLDIRKPKDGNNSDIETAVHISGEKNCAIRTEISSEGTSQATGDSPYGLKRQTIPTVIAEKCSENLVFKERETVSSKSKKQFNHKNMNLQGCKQQTVSTIIAEKCSENLGVKGRGTVSPKAINQYQPKNVVRNSTDILSETSTSNLTDKSAYRLDNTNSDTPFSNTKAPHGLESTKTALPNCDVGYRHSLNLDNLLNESNLLRETKMSEFTLSRDELELIKRYRSRIKSSEEESCSDQEDWRTKSLDRSKLGSRKDRKPKSVRFDENLSEYKKEKGILKTSLSEIPSPSRVEVTTIPPTSVQSNPTISCNVSIPLHLITSSQPDRHHSFQSYSHPFQVHSSNPFLPALPQPFTNPFHQNNYLEEMQYGPASRGSYPSSQSSMDDSLYLRSNPSSLNEIRDQRYFPYNQNLVGRSTASPPSDSQSLKSYEEICNEYLARTSNLINRGELPPQGAYNKNESFDANHNPRPKGTSELDLKSPQLIMNEMHRKEGHINISKIPSAESAVLEVHNDSDISDTPPPINYATLPSLEQVPRSPSWEQIFEPASKETKRKLSWEKIFESTPPL